MNFANNSLRTNTGCVSSQLSSLRSGFYHTAWPDFFNVSIEKLFKGDVFGFEKLSTSFKYCIEKSEVGHY